VAEDHVFPAFDPRFDFWINTPRASVYDGAMQTIADDAEADARAGSAILLAAVGTVPGFVSRLTGYGPVAADAERIRIAEAAVNRAAVCGLRLPPIILGRYVNAPGFVEDGVCHRRPTLADVCRITVKHSVELGRLPMLWLHELQHASDMHLNLFDGMTVPESERRAIAFAFNASANWTP
jgi:hypothetical protein